MREAMDQLAVEPDRPSEHAITELARALCTMVSKTGWTSVGELEMTRRISLVAVCCSRASVSSRLRASSSVNRRTFSMAMTAWSAKIWSSSISRSEKSPASARPTDDGPDGATVAEDRHRQECSR